MPLYEFRCQKCGHVFEELVRTDGGEPGACPRCGARKPVKLLSAFSARAGGGSSSGAASGSCPTGTCPFA